MECPQFESILFEPGSSEPATPDAAEPAYFHDLNLDQVWEGIRVDSDDDALSHLFRRRLTTVGAVRYRHEVFRDLAAAEIAQAVHAFSAGMTTVYAQLGLIARLRDVHQREAWLLATVRVYCDTVADLRSALAVAQPRSRGLAGLAHFLDGYVESDATRALVAETAGLERELRAITYTVSVRGLRVTVTPYAQEANLTEQIEATFAKFRQGAVKDHRVQFREPVENDPVQERILALVAELHPELFGRVADYARRREHFLDATVVRLVSELRFCQRYTEYVRPLRDAGLGLCYPELSAGSKQTRVRDAFDIALAGRLVQAGRMVVTNDFELTGAERMIVVTGPNQGGKTTFARMFGQLHHLAALGVPVPGSSAELFLADALFTHFEREESLDTLRSKFEDEMVRLRAILDDATARSVVVMNESFGSTTLRDGLWVGRRVLGEMLRRDLICLCVTFVDEFASLGPEVVSMMSCVDPDDVGERTFKVVRKPADGRAYATALAVKHGVSYTQLRDRLALR